MQTKKAVCILLSALLVLTITATAFAIDIDLSDLSDKELKQLRGQIDKELTRRAAASSLAGGDIGNYHIDILSLEMTKDMTGKDAVLINYLFANNSKKSASFLIDFSAKVYQDGVECSETYTLDSFSTMTKDVQAGGTLEFSRAYALNNDYDDITLELSEGFNFYGNSSSPLTITLELP